MRHMLAAILAACTLGAHADEATQREARALVDAMRPEQQLEGMSSAMSQAMSRQLGPSGSDPRVAQVMMSETMAVMKERALRPGGIIDMMVDAYADTFTVDELREIRAFYESAAGRKMVDSTPQLMGRVMQRSFAISREAYPEICSRARARLQAEGLGGQAAARMSCTPPPPPPGAPPAQQSAPPQGAR